MSHSVLALHDAALSYGTRTLWSGFDLDIEPGEFVAVLGANGSGKTSLMRVVLGQQELSRGSVEVAGRPVRRGSAGIGYVPQQRRVDPLTPMRAKDVVALGLDGHRWGPGLPDPRRRQRVRAALDAVGAGHYADVPVGLLSGGEQQRIRIAQAIVSDPPLLLCDEPLLSLDLNSQATVTGVVDGLRRARGTSVLFVTHEINPVLPYVDRVVYLAGGSFRIGTVDEVMTTESLSALFGVAVDVVRTSGRILVAGVPDDAETCAHHVDTHAVPA